MRYMSTVDFPFISEAWFLAAAMPVIADLGFPPYRRFAGMAVPGKWQNLANVNIKGRDRIGHYLCLEQMKPYETRASFERQSGNLIFFNAPSFRCFSVAPTRSHLTPSASIDMISTVATAMELLLLKLTENHVLNFCSVQISRFLANASRNSARLGWHVPGQSLEPQNSSIPEVPLISWMLHP